MEHSSPSTLANSLRRGIWLILGLSLLIGSVVGAAWALDSKEQSDTVPPPVTSSDIDVTCFGYVDVPEGVLQKYPEQPGRVVEICVEENKIIDEGVPILKLDNKIAEAQLEEAKADLKAAEIAKQQAEAGIDQHVAMIEAQKKNIAAKESQVDEARAQYTNMSRLVEKGLINQSQAAIARAAIEVFARAKEAEEAKLRALQAELPQLKVELATAQISAKKAAKIKAQYALDLTEICAPQRGKVLRMLVKEGDTLSTFSQQPMFYFIPDSRRIIRAELNQEFAGHAQLGGEVIVRDDTKSGGPTWHGKITSISDWYSRRRSILLEPLQFNDVRTLECIVELDEAAPELKIGQRMRITLK